MAPEAVSRILYKDTGKRLGSRGTVSRGPVTNIQSEKANRLTDVYSAMGEDMSRGAREGLPEGTHEVFEFSEILTRGGCGQGRDGSGNAMVGLSVGSGPSLGTSSHYAQ